MVIGRHCVSGIAIHSIAANQHSSDAHWHGKGKMSDKFTKQWIGPQHYHTVIYAVSREPLSKTFPDGIGVTTMGDQIIRIENATHEQFYGVPRAHDAEQEG